MGKIYILSQPVQTGKTSLLMQWVRSLKDASGILTPDLFGMRKLYRIETGTYLPLQLPEGSNGIKIGRFVFDPEIFEEARKILDNCRNNTFEWVIADEIGRLEMDRNSGLEPAVSSLIDHYKKSTTHGNLLLVIRDYLLNDAMIRYGIQDATLLDRSYFSPEGTISQPPENQPESNLTGIVLCGGQSVRMGRDKAFIMYHKRPQYAHMYEMLRPLCSHVAISCNEQQKASIPVEYPAITDSATFAGAGPMSGVLSAFEHFGSGALLVTGCDYPYLQQQDILTLINERKSGFDVVCFHNSNTGYDEPLLAIYEKQCAGLLKKYFEEGHTSLRHFLETVQTKRIPAEGKNILSVDSENQ